MPAMVYIWACPLMGSVSCRVATIAPWVSSPQRDTVYVPRQDDMVHLSGVSTHSFLVLLLFPSLILLSIYPTFTVTEVPTPIFILSRFSSFLVFLIVPKGKLLVDLGGGFIINCGSNSKVFCQTVFFNSNKKIQKSKKLPGR